MQSMTPSPLTTTRSLTRGRTGRNPTGKALQNLESHSEKDTLVISILPHDSGRKFQSVVSNDFKTSLKLAHLPSQRREGLGVRAFIEWYV